MVQGRALKGLIAGAVVLLLVPVANAGSGTQKRAAAAGVAPGVVSDLTWGISAADQDRTVAAMKDAGVRWTRLSIQWKAWEPVQGSFAQWELDRTDRAVRLCRAAGIRVLIDVLNAPAWASPTNDSGQGNVPSNPATFGEFMRFVVQRYKGRVDAYEIWNEPDISRFWNGGPNAAAYVGVLKAGYSAVKAVDASARVVSGGLSWDYTHFLGAMYKAGAKGSFDVLAIHPYPTGPLDGWQRSYRAARQTELAAGDSRPIWLTEFGFNTATDPNGWQPGSSLDEQARRLTESFALLRQDSYVQVAFYYNFRNNWWDRDNPSSMEAQFGLLRTDFAQKPAFRAFKRYATSQLAAR